MFKPRAESLSKTPFIHSVAQVFSKEQLQKLMQKFRESSVALLDENKDAMGYTTVQQASQV